MTTKIAVSLPDEQVEIARTAVKAGRATSVSAYIAESIARRQREDSMAEHFDPDRRLSDRDVTDYAWAGRALDLAWGHRRLPVVEGDLLDQVG